MKIITWEWRKQIMIDYFIFSWLHFSKHFKSVKHWSWEFHWNGSNVWYHNFRRHETDKGVFTVTKLTIRFGKRLMVVGKVNMTKYYKDVKVLEIKHGGKITYKASALMQGSLLTVDADIDDVMDAVEKMKKGYEHLSRYYPDNTWRN